MELANVLLCELNLFLFTFESILVQQLERDCVQVRIIHAVNHLHIANHTARVGPKNTYCFDLVSWSQFVSIMIVSN